MRVHRTSAREGAAARRSEPWRGTKPRKDRADFGRKRRNSLRTYLWSKALELNTPERCTLKHLNGNVVLWR